MYQTISFMALLLVLQNYYWKFKTHSCIRIEVRTAEFVNRKLDVWRNRWTDRHGETNICHTTMLWVKKQMDWQTWWNQHMPYNYVVSGIKRNWPFFLQIKGHKPWTEHIFKSKIKLEVPFMVPDLVYKWEELKLLNGNQMWEEFTDTDKT